MMKRLNLFVRDGFLVCQNLSGLYELLSLGLNDFQVFTTLLFLGKRTGTSSPSSSNGDGISDNARSSVSFRLSSP